jgi:hypothetical protein
MTMGRPGHGKPVGFYMETVCQRMFELINCLGNPGKKTEEKRRHKRERSRDPRKTGKDNKHGGRAGLQK